jgi:hypothetical protein
MLITICLVLAAIIFVAVIFFCGFALGMWHGQVETIRQIVVREIEKERQFSEIRMKESEHVTAQAKERNDSMAATMKSVYESQAVANAVARSSGPHVN